MIDQVTDVVRRNLRSPEWVSGLPPERQLSVQLQVSRPTLRLALKALQRQGLVILRSRPRQWVPVQTGRLTSNTQPKLVQFITCDYFGDLSRFHLLHLYQLRQYLHDAGVRLEVIADARLKHGSPAKILEGLVRRVRADCWVLQHSTSEIQSWFLERGLPTIVKGTCHEGIKLPSIDVDQAAHARHAVGQLLRLGHRRLVLLQPAKQGAGELVRERAFREAASSHSQGAADALVLRHDGSAEHAHELLQSAFKSKPAPTGILASESAYALSALTQLMAMGLRVPQDASIISCDDDLYLHYAVPVLTRYRVDESAYAKRLSRMVLKLATEGVLAGRPVRVIPRFEHGASLGPATTQDASGKNSLPMFRR